MVARAHKPTDANRKQVETLAAFGIPEWDIAKVVGVDPKTLRKHYRDELDLGHIKANAKVAQNLFNKACGEGRESVTAAIFWLRTRAGWREQPAGEEPGKKETANREAFTAANGTAWESLLN